MSYIPRYLLAGEPAESFIPDHDTGILLVREILSRGFAIDYCCLSQMDWRLNSSEYLSSLKVASVKSVSHLAQPVFQLDPWRMSSVEDYDVILQRKDPPVDDSYIGHCKHFMLAPERIVQMNSPHLTWKYSEHLLPIEFPKFGVPTVLCEDLDTFIKYIRSQNNEVVCKPSNMFGGEGIGFFSSDTSKNDLTKYWEKWKPKVVIQPYLHEITTIGDLRVMVINEVIVGSVLRKPRPGSRLANLHQGGSPHYWELTSKQKEASKAIAQKLCPQGLYLLGIDFIGDLVSEINITCPTTLPQINQVMGIKGESVIVNELERLRLARLTSVLQSGQVAKRLQ